jgi:hypothetical protein
MFELRISNQSLYVDDNTKLRIELNMPLPGEENIPASRIYWFDLPPVRENIKALTSVYFIDMQTYKRYSCELWLFGSLAMIGTLYVKEYTGGKVRACFASDIVSADFANTSIRDFSFPEIPLNGSTNETISAGLYSYAQSTNAIMRFPTILSPLMTSDDDNFSAPNINVPSGNKFLLDDYMLQYGIVPALYLREVLKKIFASENYQISGDFLNDSELSELVIYSHKPVYRTSQPEKYNETTSPYRMSGYNPYNENTPTRFFPRNSYNGSRFKITGINNFYADGSIQSMDGSNMVVKLVIDVSNYVFSNNNKQITIFFDGGTSLQTYPIPDDKILEIEIELRNGKSISQIIANPNGIIGYTWVPPYLDDNGVWIPEGLQVEEGASNQFTIQISCEKTNTLIGASIQPQEYLPDITTSELMNALAQTFCLLTFFNTITREVYIEALKEALQRLPVDITTFASPQYAMKIENAKDISMQFDWPSSDEFTAEASFKDLPENIPAAADVILLGNGLVHSLRDNNVYQKNGLNLTFHSSMGAAVKRNTGDKIADLLEIKPALSTLTMFPILPTAGITLPQVKQQLYTEDENYIPESLRLLFYRGNNAPNASTAKYNRVGNQAWEHALEMNQIIDEFLGKYLPYLQYPVEIKVPIFPNTLQAETLIEMFTTNGKSRTILYNGVKGLATQFTIECTTSGISAAEIKFLRDKN